MRGFGRGARGARGRKTPSDGRTSPPRSGRARHLIELTPPPCSGRSLGSTSSRPRPGLLRFALASSRPNPGLVQASSRPRSGLIPASSRPYPSFVPELTQASSQRNWRHSTSAATGSSHPIHDVVPPPADADARAAAALGGLGRGGLRGVDGSGGGGRGRERGRARSPGSSQPWAGRAAGGLAELGGGDAHLVVEFGEAGAALNETDQRRHQSLGRVGGVGVGVGVGVRVGVGVGVGVRVRVRARVRVRLGLGSVARGRCLPMYLSMRLASLATSVDKTTHASHRWAAI